MFTGNTIAVIQNTNYSVKTYHEKSHVFIENFFSQKGVVVDNNVIDDNSELYGTLYFNASSDIIQELEELQLRILLEEI